MWRVSNHKNDVALRAFEAGVITPMWAAINYAHATGAAVIAAAGTNHPALLRAFEIRYEGVALSDFCQKRAGLDGAALAAEHQCYLDQNSSLRAGNLPPPSPVDSCASQIFSKYLYEKAFADERIWNHLQPSAFSRSIFHSNFREDNPHVPACPYCDLDTVNATANSSVEHFLPRSVFPYLAMNALNLMPSCTACNTSWQGKGKKYMAGVASPMQSDVGSAVCFGFDATKEVVSVVADVSNAPVQIYIDLIGLAPRYATNRVYADVSTAGEALFDALSPSCVSEATAISYVERIRRGAPLTKALTAYVREFLPYWAS